MTTVLEQIESTNSAICENIATLNENRGLLSQNILGQIRNLVEGVAVLVHSNSIESEFTYSLASDAMNFIKGRGDLKFLLKFHKLLQISVSHYTVDRENSERLMLKYYEHMFKLRDFLFPYFGSQILVNLEQFPVDLDPSLKEYHEKIATKISQPPQMGASVSNIDRYYIHKIKPFFCNFKIYYEVTFYRAINKVNKHDRIIAFTDIDISDCHAAHFQLQSENIQVLGKSMPITLIRYWRASIRPCELKNFGKLLGIQANIKTASAEYQHLMECLTYNFESMLDLVDISDVAYNSLKAGSNTNQKLEIFPIIDIARTIIRGKRPSHNVLRYLLFRMNNQILKLQHSNEQCYNLSNLNLKRGCKPFDELPICTSLVGHNPRFSDICSSIELTNKEHEFVARTVRNNTEQNGILYTPISEFSHIPNIDELIDIYNRTIFFRHTNRKLINDNGHLVLAGYEGETESILKAFQEFSKEGLNGYVEAVNKWIEDAPRGIDDQSKHDALIKLFSESKIALIYGAAGTGKSTMVNHIAHYFSDHKKLFLAHTNPATDNLKRKVNAIHSEFRTIKKQIHVANTFEHFDLLVIDECSTVSNADLLNILETTSFELLVLVGDAYQIESIQFGNWFNLASYFIPNSAIFELETPFRTNNKNLLHFWNTVRHNGDEIAEIIVKNNYSATLDSSLFEASSNDEIILCLNYDGLYGINNINRFLQGSNTGAITEWKESRYKIGDPVLFTDSERFRPVIYNNLKGWIKNITKDLSSITFDIVLDRPLTELDVYQCNELEWVSDSTVRFTIFDSPNLSDEDDDVHNTTIPFQVAYAVSIHKAQGLEYNSVKVVVTDANEDELSHSIFYTAITRAKEQLKIFWTPETMQNVIAKLKHIHPHKDAALITSRKGLQRVR